MTGRLAIRGEVSRLAFSNSQSPAIRNRRRKGMKIHADSWWMIGIVVIACAVAAVV